MVKISGGQIQITSLDDLKELDAKLSQVDVQYVSFVVFTLTTLINQYIVDPIQGKMRSAGISSKIIDNTYLDVHAEQQGRLIIFHIKSDYVSEKGFAVARMIEYGRRAYFVVPKDATPERPNPHLSYIEDGVRKFRKKVRIPRKPPGRYIEDGIRRGQPRVQGELNKRTKKWISGILKA